MRYLILLILAISLTGCFSDQKSSLAQCEIAANKTYPDFVGAPDGQPLKQIQLCMRAAGYEWVGPEVDLRCRQSGIMQGLPELGNEGSYCFAPLSPIQKWVYYQEVGGAQKLGKSD